MLRKVIWTCLRGIQNKNIYLNITNNMLCRGENTEIEVCMRPVPGTQQALRECYLFIIISLFHPWGYTRSWAWFSITYRWRHEDPKRDQDACWPQSSTRSIKPHCFSKDWFTLSLSAYWILIAFECQACFISHQNYSFILPSSVLGGVKWYLEITHRHLKLSCTFSTLRNKFLKLQSRYQNQTYKAIHIPLGH